MNPHSQRNLRRPALPRGGRARAQRGYVLLLVLFVIALATTALAGLSRMSMERSLQASRADAELRRRWAVVSCRSVLLPKAEAVLGRADAPVNSVRRDIVLSGQPITLLFCDEQAKANVNLLYAEGDVSGAERDVRALFQAAGSTLPAELRPIPGRRQSISATEHDNDGPPAFESFGQIVRGNARPESLALSRGTLPAVANVLTCWGDGSLNLKRAPRAAVRAVCTHHLAAGEISRLLEARAKHPGMDASDLLDQLEVPQRTRETLDDLLIDNSSCHSLWIISRTGDRSWYDLAIAGAGDGETILFSW